MLTLTGISKKIGGKEILDRISLSLETREVVGLIGKNGAGKTTLLRLIAGEMAPDEGNIQRGGTVGYLPQHPDFGDLTVAGFLGSRLEDAGDEYKIGIVLEQSGLSGVPADQPAGSLSGGQKTRLHLASLLLSDPAVLLLDEPTNNLDLEGLAWLADFIGHFDGAVLLVSHDRALLDEAAHRIVELDGGKLKKYGGNYSFYREQKLLEKKATLEKYRENVREIRKLERQIAEKRERIREITGDRGKTHEKFEKHFFRERAVGKTSGVARALQTELARTGRVEKPQERISYHYGFGGEIHSDKFVLAAKHISKSFGGKVVLDGAGLSISGASHIWLAGANGSGKTTLLNILAGKALPDAGTVETGSGIRIGYFSQDASQLNLDKTGIEELSLTGTPATDCYKYAMNLHLAPDDLKKPVAKLSRGQIAKLEFIKLLFGQNHLLVLDEPTNHLEVETREEIEEALKDYRGAILVVSHDRYFLEEIGIDRILRLAGGRIEEETAEPRVGIGPTL